MQERGALSAGKPRHPLIVSYYTPGTAYEANAMLLLQDARRLGLPARIEPRPARGSWVENCAQKAGFIREMHRQEQRPLLWLDADARLRSKLRLLEATGADLGIARLHGWEFYTGQAYFGAGPATTRLLDIWCGYCERFPEIWDQVSLGYAWWELSLQEKISTIWFDSKVFQKISRRPAVRLWQRLLTRPPIVQLQESRRSKAAQGAPERREFGMDDIPLWWRQAAQRQAPFPLNAAQRSALGLA